jgi:hypothetical protein
VIISAITPPGEAGAVTPSDTTNISATRALYVGSSGDVRVQMLDGTVITLTNLAAGILHPLQVIRVYETGTTAAGIIALR